MFVVAVSESASVQYAERFMFEAIVFVVEPCVVP